MTRRRLSQPVDFTFTRDHILRQQLNEWSRSAYLYPVPINEFCRVLHFDSYDKAYASIPDVHLTRHSCIIGDNNRINYMTLSFTCAWLRYIAVHNNDDERKMSIINILPDIHRHEKYAQETAKLHKRTIGQ